MLASLTGNVYPIDISKSVIQFIPSGFVPALYGTTTGRDFAVLRWDPFHLGSDGQEIVPPLMSSFGATERDAAWGLNGRHDLARMDRVVEDRGTYVHRAHAVCIHAGGWTDPTGGRELGVRS
jgi:hypothetical protein